MSNLYRYLCWTLLTLLLSEVELYAKRTYVSVLCHVIEQSGLSVLVVVVVVVCAGFLAR